MAKTIINNNLEWLIEEYPKMSLKEARDLAQIKGNGWRLLKIVELWSIRDRKFTQPACDPKYEILNGCYWSIDGDYNDATLM